MIELTPLLFARSLVPVYALAIEGDPRKYVEDLTSTYGKHPRFNYYEKTPSLKELEDKACGDPVYHEYVLDGGAVLGAENGLELVRGFYDRRAADLRHTSSLILCCTSEQKLHPSLQGLVPRLGTPSYPGSFKVNPSNPPRMEVLECHFKGLGLGTPKETIAQFWDVFHDYDASLVENGLFPLVFTLIRRRFASGNQSAQMQETCKDGTFIKVAQDVKASLEATAGWPV